MPTNYRKMDTPTLISKVSSPRKVEAQFRLDHWTMSDKNVRRLSAYVGADLPTADPAPTAKAPKAKATRKQKAAKQATKADRTADLKAQANQAFRAAFAAAEADDRHQAGRTAYRLVMRGTPLADVLAAIG